MDSLLEIIAGILVALGGAGGLILMLSNYLGKLWAEKLMQNERQRHNIQLEELRDSLRLRTEEQLTSLRAQLDFSREIRVKEQQDRMMIYRGAVDVVAGVVAKLEMMMMGQRQILTPEELQDFGVQRLRMYAYLAMHAPQEVMDAHDAVNDAILGVLFDGQNMTWQEFRTLAVRFLNEVRRDIGIRNEPIAYRGTR